MTHGNEAPFKDDIRPEPLEKALSERYLAYALSTITSRALPDARDGLKPVHRRILYGMRSLGLDPNAAFKKSAKIVGDVMGNFHPHGDQAIYDALVRLAQDFSSRYPLVDGQGNFGNVDGDNPAAYRYTEARLTEIARLLLEGIDEDAVDFKPNYDGQSEEPVVLPAGFPNLLANGATGIAVGMATSIPPHNLGELCQALIALIENPKIQDRTLFQVCEGAGLPDRRRHRRRAGHHPGSLPHGARLVPRPRAMEEGRGRARHLSDRRLRDSLSGPEGEADRAHRAIARREEAAASSTPSRTSRPKTSASC